MKISKSLRISEKPPGMTLAEALGIIVPDNAPEGRLCAQQRGVKDQAGVETP